MKQIKNMATMAKVKAYSEVTTSHGEPSEDDKRFINELFNQLTGIFPAWKAAFDGADGVRNAKRQWVRGLVESGVTDQDCIEQGLRAARSLDSPFLPSVGQFISWCKINKMDDYVAPQIGNPTKPETFISALDAMKESLK